MSVSQSSFYISPELYLEGERESPIKHEYRRGHVYARMGAKKPHIIIADNLVTLLNNHLRETPCIVLNYDINVRLEAANCYYYPDVAITCDERDINSTEDFILFPSLVVEVLSSSTASSDRGEKFADYQTFSSLREYVLINQSDMRVEYFCLNELGSWVFQTYEKGGKLYLESVSFSCKISEIYQKVSGLL